MSDRRCACGEDKNPAYEKCANCWRADKEEAAKSARYYNKPCADCGGEKEASRPGSPTCRRCAKIRTVLTGMHPDRKEELLRLAREDGHDLVVLIGTLLDFALVCLPHPLTRTEDDDSPGVWLD